jgi:hypothetical protein
VGEIAGKEQNEKYGFEADFSRRVISAKTRFPVSL